MFVKLFNLCLIKSESYRYLHSIDGVVHAFFNRLVRDLTSSQVELNSHIVREVHQSQSVEQ